MENAGKHVTMAWNIRQYINKFVDEFETDAEGLDGLTETQRIDLAGAFDEAAKLLSKKIIDPVKKGLEFNGRKEIHGLKFKVKRQEVDLTEIPVDKLRPELSEADFNRCVKVTLKNVETFLPKARIEQLKEITGSKVSFHFESL